MKVKNTKKTKKIVDKTLLEHILNIKLKYNYVAKLKASLYDSLGIDKDKEGTFDELLSICKERIDRMVRNQSLWIKRIKELVQVCKEEWSNIHKLQVWFKTLDDDHRWLIKRHKVLLKSVCQWMYSMLNLKSFISWKLKDDELVILKEALNLTLHDFEDLLKDYNIIRMHIVEGKTKFDPYLHEAIAHHQSKNTHHWGLIYKVVKDGFLKDNKLFIFAKVIIYW